MEINTSKLICEQLKIDYIDFLIAENFIKLLDLIFKYKKCFNLCMRKRIKNFQEDVLNIFLEELEDAKINETLQVKEFACIVKNEYWSK